MSAVLLDVLYVYRLPVAGLTKLNDHIVSPWLPTCFWNLYRAIRGLAVVMASGIDAPSIYANHGLELPEFDWFDGKGCSGVTALYGSQQIV